MINAEYLENGIKVYQDNSLYTFTSDSILLSKFARVKKGDVVADFCSGSGIVGLNFYALNSALVKSVTLFEMQKPLFDLSVKSIEENDLQNVFSAVNTKLQDVESKYNGLFSLILCNPPYMKVEQGESAENTQVAVCKSEIELPLEDLVSSISRCLKFGGRTAICHRADRLIEVVCALKNHGIEPKRLQFVCAKNKAPYLVLIEGVKGGKSGVNILENLIN